MPTDCANLIAACRNLIGDLTEGSYVFSDAQLTQWINDAIADLNQHFPRQLTAEVTCTTDLRKYELTETGSDLLAKIIGIVSVEYPADQDPPQFLKPREYTHPHFWTQPGYYSFIKRYDAFVADEAPAEGYGEPPELWISTYPVSDEVIRIEYRAEHPAITDEAGSYLTVLERHRHLIHLFVRWKAWSELAIGVGMDPSPVNLLSATEEVNAYRAERSYRAALREAVTAESAVAIVEFRLDKWDRIY